MSEIPVNVQDLMANAALCKMSSTRFHHTSDVAEKLLVNRNKQDGMVLDEAKSENHSSHYKAGAMERQSWKESIVGIRLIHKASYIVQPLNK